MTWDRSPIDTTRRSSGCSSLRGDELRQAKRYDLGLRSTQDPPAQSDYGAVLNYNLFASSGPLNQLSFNGASATFDARAFSPYGVLGQSAIVTSNSVIDAGAIRLDTTFAYSDPRSLTTYRAGDAIAGGLAWTRPIRIGGAQMQRNFALRPDLVTLPLPSFSGSAAVPSTVEVYVNNLKTFSQGSSAGPLQPGQHTGRLRGRNGQCRDPGFRRP